MYALRIIAEPEKVKELLRSNIDYEVGSIIRAKDEFLLRKFASDHKDLVEEVIITESGRVMKNKLARKGKRFKTK